jgi:modulator of FtsH protease HflK
MPSGGLRPAIVLAVIAVIGLGAWTAYYTVPSDSVAVVQRFGKYLKDVPPGLHFKLPLGIDVATIVPVKRQLKQEFGFATPGASDPYQISRDGKRETQMVTGDLNAVLVEWVVQYRISEIPSNSFSTFGNREGPSAMFPNPSCVRSSAIAPWTR